MGRLIYSAIASLDGYVADESGSFGWAMPDEEVHLFVNELERPIGTYLYGRRLYEVMTFWEDAGNLADEPACVQEFGEIWRAAEKVVYSRSLEEPVTARTRIDPDFDPDGVRRMKAASERDLSVGGAELAGQALAAGLVDECHLLLAPVVVGGGSPAFAGPLRLDLELIDQRRFASGFVHLHHRLR